MAPLETLGFALAGYGCTTCIGNSGPLDEAVAAAIEANDLVVAAVLSGNRNFEGRIHPLARASYLASPPLVVAFALAGRVDIDLTTEPLGTGSDGQPVFLADIWPSGRRDPSVIGGSIDPELFRRTYAVVFEGDDRWRALPIPAGDRYAWDPASTYIARPPFLDGMAAPTADGPATSSARASSRSSATRSRPTTSRRPARSRRGRPPASGSRSTASAPLEFNSYGARRGHHEVMMRGTFGNIRLRNRLVEPQGGAVHASTCPTGEEAFIYDAAMRYAAEGVAARRSSPGASTARARRATGRPRGPPCSASGRSSPRASSGSIARTSSGWASCRSSSCRARARPRSG